MEEQGTSETRKAFVVDVGDGEVGESELYAFFAPSEQAASELAAREHGLDAESLQVLAVPAWDVFAETGEVPASAWLSAGYRQRCPECEHWVSGDQCEGYHDCPKCGAEDCDCKAPSEDVVCRGEDAFCGPTCLQAYDEARAREKRDRTAAEEAVRTLFAERLPGATLREVYASYEPVKGRSYRGAVRFGFPGGKYGGTFREGEESPEVSVAHGDLEAWKAWRASLKAPEGETT